MGLGLLPHWVIGKELERGNLVDVFPDLEVTPTDFNTAAWFVYPSATRLPKKVRLFVDHLKKEIRDNPPWMRQVTLKTTEAVVARPREPQRITSTRPR